MNSQLMYCCFFSSLCEWATTYRNWSRWRHISSPHLAVYKILCFSKSDKWNEDSRRTFKIPTCFTISPLHFSPLRLPDNDKDQLSPPNIFSRISPKCVAKPPSSLMGGRWKINEGLSSVGQTPSLLPSSWGLRGLKRDLLVSRLVCRSIGCSA